MAVEQHQQHHRNQRKFEHRLEQLHHRVATKHALEARHGAELGQLGHDGVPREQKAARSARGQNRHHHGHQHERQHQQKAVAGL